MNAMAILALVAKGLTIAEVLIAAGQTAAPALKVIGRVIRGAQAGTVTDEELEAEEAALDKMIADFNEPI